MMKDKTKFHRAKPSSKSARLNALIWMTGGNLYSPFLWFVLFLKTIKVFSYQSLGCFEGAGLKPPSYILENMRGGIVWSDLTPIILKCARLSLEDDKRIFGIEFYGECWALHNASDSSVAIPRNPGCVVGDWTGNYLIGADNEIALYRHDIGLITTRFITNHPGSRPASDAALLLQCARLCHSIDSCTRFYSSSLNACEIETTSGNDSVIEFHVLDRSSRWN
ncbi:unnamed protein product [Owenia fusiformis]|uniref:Uncharacterized protein n=1 Tax=Owenia fusiformis TaxID=6347 RepID=A0A8J1TS59_OWEFU|nr:unnamed protein product [Owenia fusiformis]